MNIARPPFRDVLTDRPHRLRIIGAGDLRTWGVPQTGGDRNKVLDFPRAFVHVPFVSAAAIPCSLPDRLGPILEGLRRLIALRAGQNHALIPWVVVLWGRLGRTLARVAAIAARHQAGTLRRPAKPRERAASPAPAPSPRPPPRDPLPRQPGWLVRRIRESGCYGEYLRLLLEEPDTRALIEAAPQLRRHLRPLWRMLRRDPVPEILRSPPAARALRRPRKRRETPPPRAAASPPPPAPRPAPSAPHPVPPAIRRIAGHAFNRG